MAALGDIERELATQVYAVIGPQGARTSLCLPYAKLVTIMMASPPLYGISFDFAVGHVLQEPFLRLPEYQDRRDVVRQLTAANLLITRPKSRMGEAR
jgi:hypothetical protein